MCSPKPRFEPRTSSLSCLRSTKLSYRVCMRSERLHAFNILVAICSFAVLVVVVFYFKTKNTHEVCDITLSACVCVYACARASVCVRDRKRQPVKTLTKCSKIQMATRPCAKPHIHKPVLVTSKYLNLYKLS